MYCEIRHVHLLVSYRATHDTPKERCDKLGNPGRIYVENAKVVKRGQRGGYACLGASGGGQWFFRGCASARRGESNSL